MPRRRKSRSKPQPKGWTTEEIIASLARIEPGCNIEQKYRGYLRLQQEASQKAKPNPRS